MRLLRNFALLVGLHLAFLLWLLAPRASAQPSGTATKTPLTVDASTGAITTAGNVTATTFRQANGIAGTAGNNTFSGNTTFGSGSTLTVNGAVSFAPTSGSLDFTALNAVTFGNVTINGLTTLGNATLPSGKTLTLSGAVTGTPTGGTLNLSNVATTLANATLTGNTTAGTVSGSFVGTATGAANAQLTATQTAITDSTLLMRLNLTNQTNGVGGTGAARAPFVFGVYNNPFSGAGQTYYDADLSIGYNTDAGGGNLVAAEPQFGWRIEQDYWDGTERWVESYFQFKAGSGVSGATLKRPIFMQISRTTGSMNSFQIRSNGVIFTSWDSASEAQFANLGQGGLTLQGYSTQSVDTALNVQAQNGQAGSLFLTGGMQLRRVSPNNWAFDISGTNQQFQIRTNDIAFGGAGNFPGGVVNIEPRAARKDNEHNLVLQRASAQSTSSLVIKDASGNYVWGVDSNNALRQTSTGQIMWGSTSTGISPDTGFSRASAGTAEVNNGTTGTLRDLSLRNLTASGNATVTGNVSITGSLTVTGIRIVSVDTLSGAGAVSVTKDTTKLTTTGSSQALTLADGTDGQLKRIVHDVDGGSAILTPTTKTGFSTITFTNVGDTVSLQFVATRGWMVVGSYGVTIAP